MQWAAWGSEPSLGALRIGLPAVRARGLTHLVQEVEPLEGLAVLHRPLGPSF